MVAIRFVLVQAETIIILIKTILYTDNGNLIISNNVSKAHFNAQLKIIELVNKYNIILKHLPGERNLADPLSRLLEIINKTAQDYKRLMYYMLYTYTYILIY